MEPPKPGMKRVTVKPKCPNPLFEKWLEEWRQEAAEKGTEMQYCFGKALRSLRKYPLPLRSGKDCIILECFGDSLCKLLDRRLSEYQKMHPEMDFQTDENLFVQPEVPLVAKKKRTPKRKKTNLDQDHQVESSDPPNKVQRRGGRPYIPAWRSGPHAILITMLAQEEKVNYAGFMLKSELQREAQPLCDKSFTRPDPGSHYTAWSSMSQLVKKGLIHKYSNPAKFQLTEEGRHLAILLKNNSNQENGDTYVPSSLSSAGSSPDPELKTYHPSPPKKVKMRPTSTCVSDFQVASSSGTVAPTSHTMKKSSQDDVGCLAGTSVVLEKGTFDIVLLVDTCETTGASKKHYDQTISELTQMKVPFQVRKLEVGDFLWIATCKNSSGELVLPYVVERKRMDDFGGSIKDGRFKEQKFRLKQSGIQNLIYLVESHGSDQHVGGLPLSTLQQAAVNTQVVDGFVVKHTIDHRHSMAYLASLTRIISQAFLDKTLFGCLKKDLAPFSLADDFITLMNFTEFKLSTKKNKNFTVKETFIRQLVQMKGLSVEKAIAIVGRYSTPQALFQAYRLGGGESLLADIPCRGTSISRTVGPVTSKAVYLMYNSEKLH